MNNNIFKNKRGFVLLYTMIISSIILAIAFGTMNIALKETNFSVSARAANEAFFAADTGAECALYYDRSDVNFFSVLAQAEQPMSCAGNDVTLNQSGNTWSFRVKKLGNSQNGCADVFVTKENFSTTIISTGYNNCNVTLGNVVERQLEVTY